MTDTPPTSQQLAEIEARVTAATPGPWQGKAELGSHIVCTAPEDGTYSVLWNAEWATEADGEFTAHARTDVPALLAEVRRLRAELGATRVAALLEAAEIADETVPPDLPRDDRDQGRVDAARDIRAWASGIKAIVESGHTAPAAHPSAAGVAGGPR